MSPDHCISRRGDRSSNSVPLPQSFIACYRDRIRKVEATDRIACRNPHLGIGGVGRQECVRQAGRLTAKYEDITRLIRRAEIRAFCLLSEQPELVLTKRLLQVIPVIDDLPYKVLPIIEPGSAEIVVINTKP